MQVFATLLKSFKCLGELCFELKFLAFIKNSSAKVEEHKLMLAHLKIRHVLACSGRRIMQNVNQPLHQIGKFEFKFNACEAKSWCRTHIFTTASAVANTARSSYARQYFKSSLCLNFHKVPQQPLSALAANQQLTPIEQHSLYTHATKPAAAKRIHKRCCAALCFASFCYGALKYDNVSFVLCALCTPPPLLYIFWGSIVRCRSAQIKLGASMEIFPPTSPAIMVHGGCEVQVISNTAESVICQHPCAPHQERGEKDAFIGRAGVPVGAFSFLMCLWGVSGGRNH